MKTKNNTNLILVMLAVFLAVVSIILFFRNEELSSEIKKIKHFLRRKYGKSIPSVTQYLKLLVSLHIYDLDIQKELNESKELHAQGKNVEVNRRMVIILENKLKWSLDQTDPEWRKQSSNKKGFATFGIMFSAAIKLEILTEEQVTLAKPAVELRNKASHKIGVENDHNETVTCLLGCMEIISILTTPKRFTIAHEVVEEAQVISA